MDFKLTIEIAHWLKAHPQHCLSFTVQSPAGLYFRFLENPDSVNEYEDPFSETMGGDSSETGCGYLFKRGRRVGQKCNIERPASAKYCLFHSHPVFSQTVREIVLQEHNRINKGLSFEKDAFCEEITIDDTKLKVMRVGHDLVKEVSRGLAIRAQGPYYWVCVGYFPKSSPCEMERLTSELDDYCQKIGLSRLRY